MRTLSIQTPANKMFGAKGHQSTDVPEHVKKETRREMFEREAAHEDAFPCAIDRAAVSCPFDEKSRFAGILNNAIHLSQSRKVAANETRHQVVLHILPFGEAVQLRSGNAWMVHSQCSRAGHCPAYVVAQRKKALGLVATDAKCVQLVRRYLRKGKQ